MCFVAANEKKKDRKSPPDQKKSNVRMYHKFITLPNKLFRSFITCTVKLPLLTIQSQKYFNGLRKSVLTIA